MGMTRPTRAPESLAVRDLRVLRQVAELPTLSIPELAERWQALMGTEVPHYNKNFLVKRLAYRLQELAYGGLAERTKQRMAALLDAGDVGTRPRRRTRRADANLLAGTRLTRSWHGQRYDVVVLPSGYEYAGLRYRTLSAVVKAITGQHKSGPAFFGLKQ